MSHLLSRKNECFTPSHLFSLYRLIPSQFQDLLRRCRFSTHSPPTMGRRKRKGPSSNKRPKSKGRSSKDPEAQEPEAQAPEARRSTGTRNRRVGNEILARLDAVLEEFKRVRDHAPIDKSTTSTKKLRDHKACVQKLVDDYYQMIIDVRKDF